MARRTGKRRPIDNRIKVGCEVRIRDAGHSYTSWVEQANVMGLTGYRGDNKGPYDEAHRGDIGVVSNICAHPDGMDTLYGIRFGKRHYLVNQRGVVFVRGNFFTEDLFTL